jgi:hypothetical protein
MKTKTESKMKIKSKKKKRSILQRHIHIENLIQLIFRD